jgi:pescadillo protein
VDRPSQGRRFLSREYVQPQWAFDSANFRVLAAPHLYAPGRPPPPHLSPFVSPEDEGYVPEYGRQLAALQEAARAARRRRAAAAAGGDVFVGEEVAVAAGSSGLSPEEELEAAEQRHAAELARELGVGWGVGLPRLQPWHSKGWSAGGAQLAAFSAPLPPAGPGLTVLAARAPPQKPGSDAGEGAAHAAQAADGEQAAAAAPRKRRAAAEDPAADEAALKDVMMTRKARKMYRGLQRSAAAKEARVAALEAKAAQLKGQ